MEERGLWEDLVTFQYLMRDCKKAGEGLFIREGSHVTKQSGIRLKERRFRLDTRKKFLTVTVVRNWSRLSSKFVSFPPLKVFRSRLDGTQRNLI